MHALKWITAIFAATHVTIRANHTWEGLLFLVVLIAFIAIAIHLRRMDPYNAAAREATSSGSSITRRSWKRIALATAVLLALALWAFYSIAVYDACLDRIDYDRARWHECD